MLFLRRHEGILPGVPGELWADQTSEVSTMNLPVPNLESIAGILARGCQREAKLLALREQAEKVRVGHCSPKCMFSRSCGKNAMQVLKCADTQEFQRSQEKTHHEPHGSGPVPHE